MTGGMGRHGMTGRACLSEHLIRSCPQTRILDCGKKRGCRDCFWRRTVPHGGRRRIISTVAGKGLFAGHRRRTVPWIQEFPKESDDMDKLNRNERISVLQRILCESPGKVFTLGYFADMLNCAKSSVSEDIDIIRSSLEKTGAGTIETIPGASGGVRYIPLASGDAALKLAERLSAELSKKERILPGGYLYMLDAIYDPATVSEVSRVFAGHFYGKAVDYVITVETKGIPLAFMTAAYLSRPLVIARRNIEATDGASVNINYVSGSSNRIQTMVLSMRSLRRGSHLLFIDDFMKGGGTTKGILELAREFDCQVTGAGVLIETAMPDRKLPIDYFSLLTLYGVDEAAGITDIRPSRMVG